MISSLAPLGVTHAMQLALLFDGKGNVTVTALMRPKKFKVDEADLDSVDLSGLRTVQVSGTIEEVQAELAAHLTTAVAKIVKHTKAIDDLDAVLAAELAEKKKAVAAKTEAKAESTKKAFATNAAKRKPVTVPADDDAEPPEPEAPTATAALPTIAGLQPAWKSLKAPAQGAAKNPPPVPAEVGTAVEDLGDFFKE